MIKAVSLLGLLFLCCAQSAFGATYSEAWADCEAYIASQAPDSCGREWRCHAGENNGLPAIWVQRRTPAESQCTTSDWTNWIPLSYSRDCEAGDTFGTDVDYWILEGDVADQSQFCREGCVVSFFEQSGSPICSAGVCLSYGTGVESGAECVPDPQLPVPPVGPVDLCDTAGACASPPPDSEICYEGLCVPILVPGTDDSCAVGATSALCADGPPSPPSPDPPSPPIDSPPPPPTRSGDFDFGPDTIIYDYYDDSSPPPAASCGPGTVEVDGVCQAESGGDDSVNCPSGQHASGGVCVPDDSYPDDSSSGDGGDSSGAYPDCGAGTMRDPQTHQCVPAPECASGEILVDGICSTRDDAGGNACSPGYHTDPGGFCVADGEGSDEPGECGDGRHLDSNGDCVSDGYAEGGTTCGDQPTCGGSDPVACAILKQSWHQRCATEQLRRDIIGDGSGLPDIGADPLPSTLIDDREVGLGALDDTAFLGGGAPALCLAPITMDVMGQSISVDVTEICGYLDWLDTLIVAIAYLVAVRILIGGK